jgi:predicted RNA-binding Zn-ribbon protein involved in translation (DUF1610 family)
MSELNQELHVSTESWCAVPVHCHECGWEGTDRDLDHVFEETLALSDEDYLHEPESKYLGAYCPNCHEGFIFECRECSWHGNSSAHGPEGFPTCPECGTKDVTLEVKELRWHLFRQSVSVEAQLGFDFAS